MTNDLVNQAHESVSRAYLRPGRPRGGAGGQTIEATMRCTFHEISSYDLDVTTEALGALQADLAAAPRGHGPAATREEHAMTRLPVKDIPDMLREACEDRGYDPTHEMTFAEPLHEWAAWEIGDGTWADMMLQSQSDFVTTAQDAA